MGPLESLSREELLEMVLEQDRLIRQLRAEVEKLKGRGGAAPFSKGKRKADPKPPGRKPGQGFFRFRGAPKAAGKAVKVPVTETCCPECGGALGKACHETVSTTDVPAQPEPEVRSYEVEVRRCRRCGNKVRGRHPDVAPNQHGATAHRVGPRVKALADILHYGLQAQPNSVLIPR